MRSKIGWRRTPKPLNKCKRILVIRPDEIGDVVMTSPFFRVLRRTAPGASITVLTNIACASLLQNCPYVDKCIGLPFTATKDARRRGSVVFAAMCLKLRKMLGGFDIVLLPRVDEDWYCAELVGHLLAGRGSVLMNSGVFIKPSEPTPPPYLGLSDGKHEVLQVQSDVLSNLHFLWMISKAEHAVTDDQLEFWWSHRDEQEAQEWLKLNLPVGSTLVFHPPGSHSPLRKWPDGKSRRLVEEILARTDFSLVVVGGPQDKWLEREFSNFSNPRVQLALIKFTLPQLGALIKQCGYFIGGDSGPMHIAAAVGAYTIGIFGPGCEQRFRPWSERSSVVSLRMHCAPDGQGSNIACCHSCVYSKNLCLFNITEEMVVKTLQEIVERCA